MIETTSSLDDEVEHWEKKEAMATRRHTCALKIQAQHVIDTLNCMKEEGLPSEEIEVAAQVANNACRTLNSQQRIRAAHLTGDTCHQAPEMKLPRMDDIVCPTGLGQGVQRSTPEQQALASRELL